jgi:hypothetical protein
MLRNNFLIEHASSPIRTTEGMATVHQPFGVSTDSESSWEQCISATHLGFILDWVTEAKTREQAAIDAFLAARGK